MNSSNDIKRQLIRDGEITDPDSPKGVLLNKAAHLFRTQGYERTTVRDIGRAVGILPGSIFHHFRSKDEILRTVMRENITVSLARLREALRCEDTLEGQLRALVRCELFATNSDETGEAWTVLVQEWRSLSPEGQREILVLREEYEQLWLETLEAARSQGRIALDPFILRRLLAGALNWTSHWFQPDRQPGLSLDELTEEVLRLVLVPSSAGDPGQGTPAPEVVAHLPEK